MKTTIVRTPPRAVLVARSVVVAVAVAHIVAIIVLACGQGEIADVIRAANPALVSSDIDKLVMVELLRSGSFHALLIVVCGVYAAKITSGSRRVYRIVVASQVLSVVVGAVTLCTGSGLTWWVAVPFPPAALLILALLIGSAESRRFFSPE